MIAIQNLKLLKGARRFGTCNSCGKGSEEAEIFRIKIETEYRQGVSICLCEDCTNILLQALEATLFND